MEPCTAARLSQPPLRGGGARNAALRLCPASRPGPVPAAAGWRLTPPVPLGLMHRSHPRRLPSVRSAGLRGRVQAAAVLPPLQSSVEAAVTTPSFVFHVAGGGKVCRSTRCAVSWTSSRLAYSPQAVGAYSSLTRPSRHTALPTPPCLPAVRGRDPGQGRVQHRRACGGRAGWRRRAGTAAPLVRPSLLPDLAQRSRQVSRSRCLTSPAFPGACSARLRTRGSAWRKCRPAAASTLAPARLAPR